MGAKCVSCEYDASIQEDGITTDQAAAFLPGKNRQEEADVDAETSNAPAQQEEAENAKNSTSSGSQKGLDHTDEPAKEQTSTLEKSEQDIVADSGNKVDEPDSNKPMEKPSESPSPEKVSETPPDSTQKEDATPSDDVKLQTDSIIPDAPKLQDKVSNKESDSDVDASLMKAAKEDSINSRKENIKKESTDSSPGGSDISKETSEKNAPSPAAVLNSAKKEDSPSPVPAIDSSEQKIESDSAKRPDSPTTTSNKDEFQTPEKVVAEKPEEVEEKGEEPAKKVDAVLQAKHIHPDVKPKASQKAEEPDEPFDKIVWKICNMIGPDDVLDITKFSVEYPSTYYLFQLMTDLESCQSPLQRTKVRWALAQKTGVNVDQVKDLYDDLKEAYDEENLDK